MKFVLVLMLFSSDGTDIVPLSTHETFSGCYEESLKYQEKAGQMYYCYEVTTV